MIGGMCPGRKIRVSSSERRFSDCKSAELDPVNKSVLPNDPWGKTVSPLINIEFSSS